MKKFTITSKTFGNHDVLLDDADFELVRGMGKWNLSVARGRLYYAQKRIDKRVHQMHRLIMGAKQGEYVDHINGNCLDNRRSNLRICSNGANIRNADIRPNNSSGYTGVYRLSNQPSRPWIAQIRVRYRVIRLGSFATFEEALVARKSAEVEFWDV